MSQRKTEPDRYDPAQPPYEVYKIDYDLFRILFAGLSPWGKCTQAESLAARLFRVRLLSMQIYINRFLSFLIDMTNFSLSPADGS